MSGIFVGVAVGAAASVFVGKGKVGLAVAVDVVAAIGVGWTNSIFLTDGIARRVPMHAKMPTIALMPCHTGSRKTFVICLNKRASSGGRLCGCSVLAKSRAAFL